MAATRPCVTMSIVFRSRYSIRAFHRTILLEKKEYDYDLDSLVKWKQETNKLFGPPRKLTKTGKLRKRSKELETKVAENIKVLSSISKENEHVIHSPGHNKNLTISDADIEIPDNVISMISPAGAVPNSSSRQSYITDRDKLNPLEVENFPMAQYVSGYDLNSNQNKTSTINNGGQFSDLGSGHGFQSESFDGQTEKLSKQNMSQACNIRSKAKVGKVIVRGERNDKLDIPKIEPVPPSQEIFNPPKKVLLSSMSSPPLEAPKSFDLISKFPLAPQQDLENVTIDDHQLNTFKEDIEQMALRRPPSVKTVLNKTMSDLSRFFLQRWRETMIKELGEEGFIKHKNETIKQGVNLHDNIMEHLSGKPLSEMQILSENEGHWASLHQTLSVISDIRALEKGVLHPALLYSGVFDCVARYKDLLCIIDWKVSKKPRPHLKNTYDDPIQVAAYTGAMNACHESLAQFGEINHGLIVVAYPDGSPAHVHSLNRSMLEHYWQEWTSRLHAYYTLAYTERLAQRQQSVDKAN